MNENVTNENAAETKDVDAAAKSSAATPATGASAPATGASAPDSLTFRQAMNELNAIVKELDSNTLELEDSLEKYERGVALVRTLKVRLSEAQQKVDVLMGELEPEPSDATTDTTLS